VIGRAKLKTLKETTLNTLWEICKLQGITSNDFNYNSQSDIITVGGSEIYLKDLFSYPSDPEFDRLGSLEITGAFIDECNQISIKAKEILKSRIRYKLDENKRIPKILMTCNPSKNWVYTDFYKPDKEKRLPEYMRFIQSLIGDNPHISKHYKEQLTRMDPLSKERLLFGNWEYDDDLSVLMDYDKITDLFTNDYIKQGEKYITADIARMGSDKCVIFVWAGWVIIDLVVFEKNDMKQVEQAIKELKTKHEIPTSNIIVDEDGVGGGVKDHLECRGFLNGRKPFLGENYANLKSQCWFKIADKVNKGQIWIKSGRAEAYKQEIIKDLESIRQKDPDKDGKLAVEGKDKIKERIGRSTDFGDAIMMRQWFDFMIVPIL